MRIDEEWERFRCELNTFIRLFRNLIEESMKSLETSCPMQSYQFFIHAMQGVKISGFCVIDAWLSDNEQRFNALNERKSRYLMDSYYKMVQYAGMYFQDMNRYASYFSQYISRLLETHDSLVYFSRELDGRMQN